jgi:hypothetical protein
MAVQSATSRIQYAGNNSTSTSYAVPFVFLENSHLQAIARTSAGVESAVTLTNHTGAGDVNGGTVRTAVAVPATSTLTIFRDVPITQTTIYQEGGDFPAASHERALDKLTQVAQQLDRGLDRTIRFSEAAPLNELPNPPTGKQIIVANNGALGWESERQVPAYPTSGGTKLLTSAGGGAVPTWQDAPSIAVGAVAATGSTTPRFLADRFADAVNVKDFGAVGDGAADDGPAIRAAIAYAVANGKAVYFPKANYRFATTTTGATELTATSGVGVSVVNNSTTDAKEIVIIGDSATVTSEPYCDRLYALGIINYKWLNLVGNFSRIHVEGVHFYDSSPRADQVTDEKRANYAIQLNGIVGNAVLYHPKKVTIQNCIFTNWRQALSIYEATNVDINNNMFLYEYGRGSCGLDQEWAVGVGVRSVSNFNLCNNLFDGCTKNEMTSVDVNFRKCADGLVLMDSGVFGLSNSRKSVVVSDNSIKHFAREGILVGGSDHPTPSQDIQEDNCVISGNALDGRYPTDHSRTTNWGIVPPNNNSLVTGNSIFQCTVGIKVVATTNNVSQFQGGHNSSVVGNHIVMAPAYSMASDVAEGGGYGTIGIEVLVSQRVLISANKIVAYDLPVGTLAGWDGGYANKPAGARIPTAIAFNGGASDGYIVNNDIRIISKTSASVLCAAFQGDNASLRLIASGNKVHGCDFLFWSVGANTSFYSDGDIFENGQRLAGASNVTLVSVFNNSAITFSPSQTGWYRMFLTGRVAGCGVLSIGTNSELHGAINQDSGLQHSELIVSICDDPDGAGGQLDTTCSISQINHASFAPQGPIITKVTVDRGYVLYVYVNRALTSGGNPVPLTVGWRCLRGTKMSISHIDYLSTQPTPTRCVMALRNGSQNITRVETGGVLLPATGSGDPVTGVVLSATGVAATDLITATGHAFVNGDQIGFQSLTGGAGLTAGTTYFVRDVAGNDFKVAATSGGAAIDFTTAITAATIVPVMPEYIGQQFIDTTNNKVYTATGTDGGKFALLN